MSSLEDKLKGNWNQIKGGLQAKWGELTDDDLDYVEGKAEQILGIIQEKTGETKEAIQKFIDDLTK